MSTRSGSFVTLRELRDDVGNDAARFFYIMRKADQATDFDLELAKSESKDNRFTTFSTPTPAYPAFFANLTEAGDQWQAENGLANLALLNQNVERDLLVQLTRYPEVLANSAEQFEHTPWRTTCASWQATSTVTTTPIKCWARTPPCAMHDWPFRLPCGRCCATDCNCWVFQPPRKCRHGHRQKKTSHPRRNAESRKKGDARLGNARYRLHCRGTEYCAGLQYDE